MTNIWPFNGVSLRGAFGQLADEVQRAQLAIYLISILLTVLKICVIFPYFAADTTVVVAFIAALLSVSVLFISLLKKPSLLHSYIHVGLVVYAGYLISVVFFSSKVFGFSTLQEVYLIMIWAFYGLGRNWGIAYGTALASVIAYFLLMDRTSFGSLPLFPESIPFGVAMLVISTNFALTIFTHYYYQNAVFRTVSEKTKLNKRLHKLLAAKTDFLATMSHELRTPLNSVIGITNLLIDNNKDTEQKEDLKNLRFSAESLLLFINDILDFNKIDSHKVELESIPFHVPGLLEGVSSGLRPKAQEKDLYVRTHITARLTEIEVLGDPKRLTQIIFNLVGNAIKFTDQGGVDVTCDLVKEEDGKATIRFDVSDSGIGIAPEYRQLIFEPFTQASRNIARRFGGTGLGLAIVKHLVSLHGSSIQLQSSPGIGSRFHFVITYPLYQRKRQGKIAPAADADIITKEPLDGLRLLMAEDNEMSIIFMKKLLAKWNVEPDVAINGQEAIDKLNSKPYDVILMDLHMPVLNGIDATQQIRTLDDPSKSGVHILALTASVSDEIIANITQWGFDDYLGKPFRPNDLHRKLETAMNMKKQDKSP